MKAGDIVKHKLTGEKLIILSSRNWEAEPHTRIRRKNWEDRLVYESEIEPIRKAK